MMMLCKNENTTKEKKEGDHNENNEKKLACKKK